MPLCCELRIVLTHLPPLVSDESDDEHRGCGEINDGAIQSLGGLFAQLLCSFCTDRTLRRKITAYKQQSQDQKRKYENFILQSVQFETKLKQEAKKKNHEVRFQKFHSKDR